MLFKLVIAAFSYAWIMEPDPAFEQKFTLLKKDAQSDPKEETLSLLDKCTEFKTLHSLKARL